MSDYTIRPMRPDDTQAILSLLTTCLGQTVIPRTKEFWNWKHFQNPFGTSPGLVAESGNQMIGLRVFMQWIWKSDRSELRSARAVDTATHPDWRGKGIFSDLTTKLLEDCLKNELSFIYNTPNGSSLPGYLKMGWKVVGKLSIWFRPLRPFRMMRRALLRNANQSNSNQDPNQSLTKILPEEVDDQILQIQDNRLQTKRSTDYLKWRYEHIPGIRYSVKHAQKKNASAMMIYRERFRNGMKELSISELFMSVGNAGISLARDVVEESLRESSADYAISLAAQKSAEQAALYHARFFPIPRLGPVFTVRELNMNDSYPPISDWKNWRCSIGDLELF